MRATTTVPGRVVDADFPMTQVVADIDMGMISLSKSVADPAGHYSRPDVTRLLLNKTPGDRVVANVMPGITVADDGMGEPAVPSLVS